MLVGRGRGHVSRDRNELLRRPVNTLEVIASKIAVLEVDSVPALKEIQDDIAKYCVTVDKLNFMINDLHERSLLNRKFGAKCVVALATQSQLTVDGTKLRSVLMQNIQTEFEDRENLRHHNMQRFLNALTFIGEVYRNIRLADNAPIAVLASAIIEYCKLLITGSEQEMQLCVQQLAYNGKLMQQTHDKDLKGLQLLIREACMSGGQDSKSLCWLCLACDLERTKYESLSEHLHDFYKKKLGKESFWTILELLNTPDPVIITDAGHELLALNCLEISSGSEPKSPSPVQSFPVSQIQKSPVSPKTLPKIDSNKRRGNENGSGDSTSAARPALLPTPSLEARTTHNPSGKTSQFGSGRFAGKDRRDDPRNDPANWLPGRESIPEKDKGVWGSGQNKGSSYGHDDRFEKEDGYYNKREHSTQKWQSKGESWRSSKDSEAKSPPSLNNKTCEESWD